MLIGILQCGHAPDSVQDDHGDFDTMFFGLLKGQGLTFKTWNVVDMDFPDDPSQADGWLLTGSKHGAYEDHPFIPPLSQLIRDIYVSDHPMVGICFGHQMIAQALGGRVEKYQGGWAIGRQEYEFGGHGALAINAWHQDQVIEKPDDAQVIGKNEFCQYAALVYGNQALTYQPHPEMSNPITKDYVSARRDNPLYPTDIMDQAIADTTKPIQDATIAKDIADFFKGEFQAKVIA